MPTYQLNNCIAISLGDPGGIGSEVTLKALSDLKVLQHTAVVSNKIKFVLFGSYDYAEKAKKVTDINLVLKSVKSFEEAVSVKNALPVVDFRDSVNDVKIGEVTKANAKISFDALKAAVNCVIKKQACALVTASINKEAVQLIDPEFTGHTEFLAKAGNVDSFAMMLQGGPIRVVLVTTHCPLKDVAGKITTKKIVEKIRLVDLFLRSQLGIQSPRIGVAALNPHAGEGGKMGTEESDFIQPAIDFIKKEGVFVQGPIPADIIFHEAYEGRLDAIVAMYHDQALAPLKMIAFHSGVNITLGLPFIRTSPDHGTAFDIAYQNKANSGSMVEAILNAIQLSML